MVKGHRNGQWGGTLFHLILADRSSQGPLSAKPFVSPEELRGAKKPSISPQLPPAAALASIERSRDLMV